MNSFAGVMKSIAGIGLLGVTAFVPSQAQSSVETEKDLISLQYEWADARIKRDIPFLERLYAREFRITAMNGSVVERDVDIARFASGDLKPESIVDEDMKATVYGDVGIVTGVESVKGTYKGNYGEFTSRFTNIFVRRDRRWQMVAAQGTPIAGTGNDKQGGLLVAGANTAQIASPEALVDEFIKAWNAHEAKSFERVFTENAIFVPVAEYMNEGRDLVLQDFRVAHTGWAKTVGLALSSEKKVLRLRPDVAVVFFHTNLLNDGKRMPGIDRAVIFVAVNEADGWRIAAGQLTKESPKRPATDP